MARNPFWTATDAALRQSVLSWRSPASQLVFDRTAADGSPRALQVLVPLTSANSLQSIPVNLPAGATIPLVLVAQGTYTPSLSIYDSAGFLQASTSMDAIEEYGQDTIVDFTVPQSGTYYLSVAWKYVQGAEGDFGIALDLPRGTSAPASLLRLCRE